jgi:alpha-beta hydrolase superfamily lysophospholipase
MRPDNYSYPVQKFETVRIQSNKNIECWKINTENSRGTVILFHGYDNSKSSMIGRSNEFIKMGYSTLLVDFMGSGGSEGMQTTIGFKEAEEVKSCYDYARSKGEQNIILFGTSMGAAAILKAIHDYKIIPSDIIIECPFSAIFSAVCNRFEAVNIPIFPLAPILTFWEVWKMVSGFLVSVRLIMPEK